MENDIETVEIAPGEFGASPFPLSVNTQKRLLELIYNRKSGIVTRQELIMLSLIKRVMRAIDSFDAVLERLDEAEDRLEKLERVRDENDALWMMIDEARDMEETILNSQEDYGTEVAEIMLRHMKVQGDA